MIEAIKNKKFNLNKLVEILFYSFPFSFVIGNLAISLNTLLFLIFALFLIKVKRLNFRFKNIYWLIIFLFLYISLLTVIKLEDLELLYKTVPNWSTENHPVAKSLLLFRFLILIFVIDTLFFNKILKLRTFLLISLFCASFVSFDIILQYLVGHDLFGFESKARWNSGPFGDELIAGAYLQKLSFLSIFYFFSKKNFNKKLLIFLIAFYAASMLLAGNKMSLLLFLFGCFLVFIFSKKLRLVMSLGIIIFIGISSVILKTDKNFADAYRVFYGHINFLKPPKIKSTGIEKAEVKTEEEKMVDKKSFTVLKQPYYGDYGNIRIFFLRGSGHSRVFMAAIEMWKEEPVFGFGLKSFRVKCWDILPQIKNLSCSTHPHNYYLELLSETGIIGFILIIIFFLILLLQSFNYLKKNNQSNNPEKYFLVPIMIIFFLEIWPLRSSGSFFTTWNATFFWLIISILLAKISEKNFQK